MNTIWLVSYLCLWIVVMSLVLAVSLLMRQLGLLHRRIAPSGARLENAGPQIGSSVRELDELDSQGRRVTLGGEHGKQTLLVFVSATCQACDGLAPAIRSVWKSERESTDVVLVSLGGDLLSNRAFVRRHKLEAIPYLISEKVASQYSVLAPPYALLIDQNRVLRAKGVVNHLEHLESLFNAVAVGHASLQSYARIHYKHDRAMTTEAS
jgi:methylamine dehydrogenase accessory protein MauD